MENARCGDCGTDTNVCYRCTECMYASMLCGGCIITRHRYQPFHHVEVRVLTFTLEASDPFSDMVCWMLSSDGTIERGACATDRSFEWRLLPTLSLGPLEVLDCSHERRPSCQRPLLWLRPFTRALAATHTRSLMAVYQSRPPYGSDV
jgi:hypothetical protein